MVKGLSERIRLKVSRNGVVERRFFSGGLKLNKGPLQKSRELCWRWAFQ